MKLHPGSSEMSKAAAAEYNANIWAKEKAREETEGQGVLAYLHRKNDLIRSVKS